MNGTLDDLYFEWLYGIIWSVRNRNPARSYWQLSQQLYGKEFIWYVPNDDNRVEDGKELREEFLEEKGIDGADQNWLDLGCSMFEMLVALSRRASYEADYRTPGEWFGIFLTHMDIVGYNDEEYTPDIAQDVDEKIDRVIYRRYSHDGSDGGLFPLRNPRRDQREVELWYQMSAYLLEDIPA